MKTDLFDYPLPEHAIAQRPPPERDGARLLHVEPRAPGHGDGAPSWEVALFDRAVRDLPSLLPPGALVVLNDTAVIPARLVGTRRGTGGKVEILLLEPEGSPTRWKAMARASKAVRPGTVVEVSDLVVRVVGDRDAEGLVTVELDSADPRAALDRVGRVPLPPYVRREAEEADRERYQTVYAREPGAVAAPTAGLHLSERVLSELSTRCELARVTLHVGLGTFRPVSVSDLDQHDMHSERFEVPAACAEAIARARARGAPVVAIGTTVVRTLESAADPNAPGLVRASAGDTNLLIQPGYRFRVVDALFTNFHMPRSTLLALVSAFVSRDTLLAAYAHALAAGYQVGSYGDAMLLTGLEPSACGPRP